MCIEATEKMTLNAAVYVESELAMFALPSILNRYGLERCTGHQLANL